MFGETVCFKKLCVCAFLGALLAGSEGDLVEDELGNWVGESGGNWESGRLGLVSLSISDKGKVEALSVGVGEADGSLGFDGAIRAGTVAGLGSYDAVTSFDVEAVFSSGAWVDDVLTEDFDNLEGSIVATIRVCHGHGEEGGENNSVHGCCGGGVVVMKGRVPVPM